MIEAVKKAIPTILTHYAIGDFLDLKPVKGGFTNENYLLETTHGDFFLKKYSRATSERVSREHRLISWLNERRFPVPGLIETKYNTTFVEHDGHNYAILIYIDGFTPQTTTNVNEKQLVSLAENLARYHWIVKEIPLDLEPTIPIVDPVALMRLYDEVTKILNQKSQLDDFDKIVAPVVPKKIEELHNLQHNQKIFETLPALLTHGDFHSANMKFNNSGEVIAIFDWELAKLQPRVWEVISAALFACKLEWKWNFFTPVNFNKIKSFLSAYHRINPLLPQEIEHIPTLLNMASADISWPLSEHYIHKNFQFDRFVPEKYENWFFWKNNSEKLQKYVLDEFRAQTKLI